MTAAMSNGGDSNLHLSEPRILSTQETMDRPYTSLYEAHHRVLCQLVLTLRSLFQCQHYDDADIGGAQHPESAVKGQFESVRFGDGDYT